MIHFGRVSALVLSIAYLTTTGSGQEPGDVYRDYGWKNGPWQRVVGPDATLAGAKALLPNPVNSIRIQDLGDSIRAEIQIEKLTSHAGTVKPRIRVNGNAWLDIPEPGNVPGTRGTHTTTPMYMTMFYPKVSIPLSHLKQGSNRFELTCQAKGASGFGALWPQFIIYGVTFRIYYKQSKPHATGAIIHPRPGSVLRADPTFVASVQGAVSRVDFVGDYHDFNWRGDGTATGWQCGYRYSAVIDHVGSATSAPWSTRWDTTWVPSQARPFRVTARIQGSDGIVYVSEPVTGLSLARQETVVRYINNQIPREWVANYWNPKKEAFTTISEDLTKASEAKLFLRTWNGRQDGDIGVNQTKYHRRPGEYYDLSWERLPLPLSALKQGVNQVYTSGTKQEHGMEVLWPGVEIFVRYQVQEALGEFVTFGEGCSSPLAAPVLSANGRPALGTSHTVLLSGATARAPAFLLWGRSNTVIAGFPLPIPLGGVGAPGCSLLTSAEGITCHFTDTQGNKAFPVYIPDIPVLQGQYYFNQVMLAEPRANPVGVLTSNATRSLIGK